MLVDTVKDNTFNLLDVLVTITCVTAKFKEIVIELVLIWHAFRVSQNAIVKF